MKTEVRYEAEVEFICSLLNNPAQYRDVKFITPESLLSPTARLLYQMIIPHDANVSAVGLFDEIQGHPQGGVVLNKYPTINELKALWSRGYANEEPAEHIAHRLQEDNVRLKMADIMLHPNPDLSPSDQAAEMAKRLGDIAGSVAPKTDNFLLSTAADKVMERYLWEQTTSDQIGFKSGDAQYDKFLKNIGGLIGGKMIVTCGFTSMGKTQWMINNALGLATTPRADGDQKPAKVVFFSLEMDDAAMAARMIAWKSQVNFRVAGDPQGPTKVKNAVAWLKNLNTSGHFTAIHHIQNLDGIRRKLYQMIQLGQCDIAFIDYLALVQGPGKFDNPGSYMRVGEVAKGVQAMALELGIPIITAAQLNRSSVSNAGGRGDLSNVADTMHIANSADAVHIIWRPDQSNKGLSGQDYGIWKNIFVLETHKVRGGPQQRPLYYTIDTACSRFSPVTPELLKLLESPAEQEKALKFK